MPNNGGWGRGANNIQSRCFSIRWYIDTSKLCKMVVFNSKNVGHSKIRRGGKWFMTSRFVTQAQNVTNAARVRNREASGMSGVATIGNSRWLFEPLFEQKSSSHCLAFFFFRYPFCPCHTPWLGHSHVEDQAQPQDRSKRVIRVLVWLAFFLHSSPVTRQQASLPKIWVATALDFCPNNEADRKRGKHRACACCQDTLLMYCSPALFMLATPWVHRRLTRPLTGFVAQFPWRAQIISVGCKKKTKKKLLRCRSIYLWLRPVLGDISQ
ncbi:hypothetical protein GGR58DRAFT_97869 [Xylaria digitata]|nr:hypothetical protein GGR58DRAFT_97869 [Xylaria digitata]